MPLNKETKPYIPINVLVTDAKYGFGEVKFWTKQKAMSK